MSRFGRSFPRRATLALQRALATTQAVTALLRSNTFEGGTNGTTISTANSGGTSGDAFPVVSGAPVFSNVQAKAGTLSMALTGPTGGQRGQYQALGGGTGDVWFRCYIYVPTQSFVQRNTFMRMDDSANAITGRVAINASGVLQAGVVGTTATGAAFPLNQWVRVEARVRVATAGAAQCEARVYLGDSLTLFDTAQVTTGTATGTVTDRVTFGWEATGEAFPATIYIDDVAVSLTGWIGPSAVAALVDQGTVQATATLSGDEMFTDAGTLTAAATLSGVEALSGGDITDAGTVTAVASFSGVESFIDSGTLAATGALSGVESFVDLGTLAATGALSGVESFLDQSTTQSTASFTGAQVFADQGTVQSTASFTDVEVSIDLGAVTASASITGADAIVDQSPTTAGPVTYLADTFTRSVGAGGWGVPDSGSSAGYTIVSGTASWFSVNGSAGLVTYGAGHVGQNAIAALDTQRADIDATVKASFSQIPDAGTEQASIMARVIDSSNFLRGSVILDSSGAVIGEIRKTVAGTSSIITSGSGSFASLATLAANQAFWIRLRIVGSSWQLKAWLDGSSEPGSFDISGTEATDITAAGDIGLRAITIAPMTRTPVITFDSLTVSSTVAGVGGAVATASFSGTELLQFADAGTLTAAASFTGAQALIDAGTLAAAASFTGVEVLSSITDSGTVTAAASFSAAEIVFTPDSGTVMALGSQPGFATTYLDTFTRSGSDLGGDWVSAGFAGIGYTITTDGSRGVFSPTNANSAQARLITIFGSLADVDVYADVQFETTAVGNPQDVGLIIHFVDGNNYIRMMLRQPASGTTSLRLDTVSGGTTTNQASTAMTGFNPVTNAYSLHLQARGSTLNGRAWLAGTGEPSTWDVTGTIGGGDSTTGSVGVRVITGATETSLGDFYFDNFQILIPGIGGVEFIVDQGAPQATAAQSGVEALVDQTTVQATATVTGIESTGAVTDSGTVTGTASFSGAESIPDSGTIAAVASYTGAESFSDSGTLQATASFTATEIRIESGTIQGVASATGVEAIADAGTVTGAATQTDVELFSDSGTIVGAASQTDVELISDSGTITATASFSGAQGDAGTVAGSASFSGVEAISDSGTITALATQIGDFVASDTGTCAASASLSGVEGLIDQGTLQATATIIDVETYIDSGATSCAASHTGAESFIDSGTITAVASVSGSQGDSGTITGTGSVSGADALIDQGTLVAVGSLTESEVLVDQGTLVAIVTPSSVTTGSDFGFCVNAALISGVEAIVDQGTATGVATPTITAEAIVDQGPAITGALYPGGSTYPGTATFPGGGFVPLGTASFTGAESFIDTGTLIAIASQTGTTGGSDLGTCVAGASQTAAEAIIDSGTITGVASFTEIEARIDSGTSPCVAIFTAAESISDSGTVVAVATHSGAVLSTDAGTNTASGVVSGADVLVDAGTIAAAALFSGVQPIVDVGECDALATITGNDVSQAVDSGICAALASFTALQQFIDAGLNIAVALPYASETIIDAGAIIASESDSGAFTWPDAGIVAGSGSVSGIEALADRGSIAGSVMVVTVNEVISEIGQIVAQAIIVGDLVRIEQGISAAVMVASGIDVIDDHGVSIATVTITGTGVAALLVKGLVTVADVALYLCDLADSAIDALAIADVGDLVAIDDRELIEAQIDDGAAYSVSVADK